jgi:hypothetical protein
VSGLVVGCDMAIDTGIFDYGNINFMKGLPALPGTNHTLGIKNKGKACDSELSTTSLVSESPVQFDSI